MPYIGRTLGQGTRSRFLYTATAGQTTFSGSDSQSNTLAYSDNNGLDCFQNGVLLKGGGADYTAATGTSVVLTTGASVDDVIEILVYDVFAIADHVKKSGDAMTGNLTVGTTSSSQPILQFLSSTSGANTIHFGDGSSADAYRGYINYAHDSDSLQFASGGSERMRIDSSGRILIGKNTTSTSTAGIAIRTTGSDAGRINHSTPAEAFYFYDSADGAQVGYIVHNGSGTTYGSGSDYRLKENIVTNWDATTRLKQLKPTRFSWKKESKTQADTDGFLAHEVSSIVPEAVRGEKDAVDADGNPDYQGVDQSKLVPLLTKALQEAVAKIETLEAKVTALEGKE